MSKPTTLSQLRASKTNPRKIETHKLRQLKKTMARFGDLGGIVRNVADWCGPEGELIGGHQRVEAYRADPGACDIHIQHRYSKPTQGGTVAEGYITIAGEKFSYRECEFDRKTATAAMLSANKSAGEWDLTSLTAAINSLADGDFDMDLTMFDGDELAAYLPDDKDLATAAQDDDYDPTEPTPQEGDMPPVGTVSAQPAGVPTAHIKMVQLFFRAEDHVKFVELTDALKGAYSRDNLPDTVMEAIERASISAALK